MKDCMYVPFDFEEKPPGKFEGDTVPIAANQPALQIRCGNYLRFLGTVIEKLKQRCKRIEIERMLQTYFSYPNKPLDNFHSSSNLLRIYNVGSNLSDSNKSQI